MKTRRTGIWALVLTFTVGVAMAEPWPAFRGVTGQGVTLEKGFPLKWGAAEGVVWKAPIPGEAWSSPVVWGDRVYVTTATEAGASCRVMALDAVKGGVVWEKEVFRQIQRRKEGRNTYATPTPVTNGEMIYACFGDGSFVGMRATGEVVWVNRDYPFYSQHGLGSSLVLHGGLVIMARDGSSEGPDKTVGWQKPWDQSYVVALDAATGKQRWKTGRGMSRISHGTPVVWRDGQGLEQVVTEAGDVVQGFDLKTGERLWTQEVLGEGKVPSVVLSDGLVFTSGGWGGRESIKAFKLGGVGDLKVSQLVWEQKKGMPKVPSMVVAGPHLFAVTDGGIATCMKASTGEIVWQERLGGNFSSSPVVAEGRVYLVGDNGETVVIEAGPEFKILSRNPLGEKVQSSPAFSGGRIYIRTEQHLFCVGVR